MFDVMREIARALFDFRTIILLVLAFVLWLVWWVRRMKRIDQEMAKESRVRPSITYGGIDLTPHVSAVDFDQVAGRFDGWAERVEGLKDVELTVEFERDVPETELPDLTDEQIAAFLDKMTGDANGEASGGITSG